MFSFRWSNSSNSWCYDDSGVHLQVCCVLGSVCICHLSSKIQNWIAKEVAMVSNHRERCWNDQYCNRVHDSCSSYFNLKKGGKSHSLSLYCSSFEKLLMFMSWALKWCNKIFNQKSFFYLCTTYALSHPTERHPGTTLYRTISIRHVFVYNTK